MKFIPIDIEKHIDYVVSFRRDSFVVSFGSDKDFGDDMEYLDWLKEQTSKYPSGFVLLIENGVPIGQLELTIKKYEGKEIGYVNLYYLIPEKRGIGIGGQLHHYAIHFFQNNNVNEYHLRVSPTNEQAIAFYRKNGMKKMKSEMDGRVTRMVGYI
ncbi:MAG: GNAT family N-acetyltransferase [Heyndrickxia sp.]